MTDLLTPDAAREIERGLLKTDSGYDPRKKYCPPLGRPPQLLHEIGALAFLREREKLDAKSAPEISENSGSEPHKTPEFYAKFYADLARPRSRYCVKCGVPVPVDSIHLCTFTRADHLPSLLATQTQDMIDALSRRLDAMKAEIMNEIQRVARILIEFGDRDGP